MAITVQLPKDVSGFEAEVNLGEDFHLVLRAMNTAVGPVMNIYDAKRGRWQEREYAGSLDDAKAKAEKIARAMHKHARLKKEFPPLTWQAI